MMSKQENAHLATLVGLPYIDGGRNPDTDKGLDCWGLFREARKRTGHSVPPEYMLPEGEERHIAFLKGEQSEEWREIEYPKAHCLALMTRPDSPEHCGFVLENEREILHACIPCVKISGIDVLLRMKKEIKYYEYVGESN